MMERRWWRAGELRQCCDRLLPAELPVLLDELRSGRFGSASQVLTG